MKKLKLQTINEEVYVRYYALETNQSGTLMQQFTDANKNVQQLVILHVLGKT